jgi:hypothetical protein
MFQLTERLGERVGKTTSEAAIPSLAFLENIVVQTAPILQRPPHLTVFAQASDTLPELNEDET